jgi:hypothetical protein
MQSTRYSFIHSVFCLTTGPDPPPKRFLHPLFLIKFLFSRHIIEKIQKPNFMKIRPMGAELVHADEQTNRHDEANWRFHQILLKHLQIIQG